MSDKQFDSTESEQGNLERNTHNFRATVDSVERPYSPSKLFKVVNLST